MVSLPGGGGLVVRAPSPRPGHFNKPATPEISPRTPDEFSMGTEDHASIVWVMHALRDERQVVAQELERRHNALFEKLTIQFAGTKVSRHKHEEPKLAHGSQDKEECAPSSGPYKPVRDNQGHLQPQLLSSSPTPTSLGKQQRPGTLAIAEYPQAQNLKRLGSASSASSQKSLGQTRGTYPIAEYPDAKHLKRSGTASSAASQKSLGQSLGTFQIAGYLDAKVLERSGTATSAISNKTSASQKSSVHTKITESQPEPTPTASTSSPNFIQTPSPKWQTRFSRASTGNLLNRASTGNFSGISRGNSFDDKVRSARASQAYSSEGSLSGATNYCQRLILLLRRLVYDPLFELVLGILIVLNTCTLAVEVQYMSFDVAELVELSNSSGGSEQIWPGAKETLHIAEFIFGAIFTLEVVSKVVVGPCIFVKSLWNWFDALIVAFWMISSFGNVKNTSFLRILRLGRMFRMLRMIKTIHIFEVLHLLLGSLKASAAVMLGSLMFISSVILCCALLINFSVDGYLRDPDQSTEHRQEVFKWYGSFSRSTLSMFEMTLGNWGPPVRVLQENVSEWYGAVLLMYVCIVHFAVVQVVRGVFINETFQVVASDDDIMIMQKERKSKKMHRNLYRLFEAADEDESGTVSKEEFIQIVEDPRVKSWLSAMDFDIYDPHLVFELLDVSRSNQLSAEQVVHGVTKLTGPSRSCDLMAAQKQLSVIQRSCRDVAHSLAQAGISKIPIADEVQRRFSLMASCTEGPYNQSLAF